MLIPKLELEKLQKYDTAANNWNLLPSKFSARKHGEHFLPTASLSLRVGGGWDPRNFAWNLRSKLVCSLWFGSFLNGVPFSWPGWHSILVAHGVGWWSSLASFTFQQMGVPAFITSQNNDSLYFYLRFRWSGDSNHHGSYELASLPHSIPNFGKFHMSSSSDMHTWTDWKVQVWSSAFPSYWLALLKEFRLFRKVRYHSFYFFQNSNSSIKFFGILCK